MSFHFSPRPNESGRPQTVFQPDSWLDPFGEDEDNDLIIQTTERRLARLVMTACDVGARFARERIDQDPVMWMFTPLRLFEGGRAIDASQDLIPFIRSMILHGLCAGLDADPEEIAAKAEIDVRKGTPH